MNLSFIQPPQVEWASGVLADGPLLRKSTRIQDLAGVFADEPARQQLAGERVVYDVEMLDTSPAEGELYTGVTHLYPGRVGREYFMTRGHFHARREQGKSISACAVMGCCFCKLSRVRRGLKTFLRALSISSPALLHTG